MSRVLVTGATGFVGRHAVVALAERGYEVHGVARKPGSAPAVHWHAVDLFDANGVVRLLDRVRPSHLLHLAWEARHDRYWTSPDNVRWVEATLRLWRLFHEAGGRRAVGAGTCAEYAWDDKVLTGAPIHETTNPRHPQTFYGIAKNATFDLLTNYSASVGLAFAWGRLFFPYGADSRATLVPSVIRALRDGRPALCTHGRQLRDFIYVADAGAAFAALVASEVEGPVNIASGSAVSIADVVSHIGLLMERPELVRLGALEAREHEPACLRANVRRLQRDVGFTPKIGLPQGLQETIHALTQRDEYERAP